MKLNEWLWIGIALFVALSIVVLLEYFWPVDYYELAEIWASIWVF